MTMDYSRQTAFCGIDCFHCELHEANAGTAARRAVDEQAPQLAGITCKGCRDQGGCVLSPTPCATRQCAAAKGVSFCFECADFPCERLNPTADGASRYPHNLKIFNLCRTQAVGIDAWSKEAAAIRTRYFKGAFRLGDTPSVE